jgi:hypothetical protein
MVLRIQMNANLGDLKKDPVEFASLYVIRHNYNVGFF